MPKAQESPELDDGHTSLPSDMPACIHVSMLACQTAIMRACPHAVMLALRTSRALVGLASAEVVEIHAVLAVEGEVAIEV